MGGWPSGYCLLGGRPGLKIGAPSDGGSSAKSWPIAPLPRGAAGTGGGRCNRGGAPSADGDVRGRGAFRVAPSTSVAEGGRSTRTSEVDRAETRSPYSPAIFSIDHGRSASSAGDGVAKDSGALLGALLLPCELAQVFG